MSDDLEIHFLGLPKLEAGTYSLEDRLVKWLLFIRGVGKERWEELASGEPALRKAMTTVQDREARMLYEMRQKALRDRLCMIEGSKEEGRVEVAKNMLIKGMDAGLIAELTGLTLEEIEDLRKRLAQ